MILSYCSCTMHVLFSQLANLSCSRREIYLKLIRNRQLDKIHPGEDRADATNYFANFTEPGYISVNVRAWNSSPYRRQITNRFDSLVNSVYGLVEIKWRNSTPTGVTATEREGESHQIKCLSSKRIAVHVRCKSKQLREMSSET